MSRATKEAKEEKRSKMKAAGGGVTAKWKEMDKAKVRTLSSYLFLIFGHALSMFYK